MKSYSQSDLTHYYIEVTGKKTENFEYSIGKIQYDEEYNPKKVNLPETQTISQLNDLITGSLQKDNTSEILNVLIHGIWGDVKFEWKTMVKNASQSIYIDESAKQKVILSIIWDSSINYVKGIKIARKKGDYLAPLMKGLVANSSNGTKVNFLCHSMGNRVFEHMITKSGIIADSNMVIDQYISVGADLQSDIFEEGQSLHGIDKVIRNITIYVHNNDRSLKVSKLINKNLRLGLHGIPNISESPENFRMIDVSVIKDNKDLGSSMSNHRYFYMSPTIMKDLNGLIWRKDFSASKKELDHPRRLKLLPSE